jgi:apolipoprotein N-acyltransferase
MQSREREVEILRRYARQSLDAVRSADQPIAAVVWPESTFTGDLPWRFSDSDAVVPEEVEMTGPEYQTAIASNQRLFLQRTRDLQRAWAAVNAGEKRPHLIAGCGVVHHGETTSSYSGVVHVTPDGELEDWYGKTHLVMFGEYIPWIGNIPVLRRFIPPGMGIQVGSGPELFRVGEILLAPSICIETAVERVMVRQFGRLRDAEDGTLPDAVVTVTNDAWFNGTSVVEHHLRCGQLLAVGLRRPILSAANGGPTAWVDRYGRVVERLASDAHGAVIAQPGSASGTSLYVRIGDWPARLAALGCLVAIADLIVASWRQRRVAREADLGTDDT